MIEFLHAFTESPILRRAVASGALAGITCGVVGSFVVVRRITYLGAGIAHCVLGGMGAAWYAHIVGGVTWLHPLHGAILAAVLAAVVIGIVSLRFRQREDTVISALWALGMAVGVLFIQATPGYRQDLMSYLFGNITLVSPQSLKLTAVMAGVVILLATAFYKQFLAICFDEEFARTRGLRVEAYYLLLLILTALSVVTLVSVVGIVLVIALLTLPVATAAVFTRRLWQLMLAAAALSVVLVLGGLAISYSPNLPPGATTIVLAGAVYLLMLGGSTLIRRLRPSRR
ncbi:MAG: metal ABC transporter permease [Phycisphaerae bacterium]|nr:metal ABC transporter permease [Phycisphaerae bacterium]